MDLQDTLAAAAALLGAAMGGLYFGFSLLVMPGLARTPDDAALRAMQQINRSIRPVFLLLFLGSALVAVASAVAELVAWQGAESAWRVVGDVLIALHFVITGAFHIPRNNAVDRLSPGAAADLQAWRTISRQWTIGNHVRGWSAFVGAGILIATLLL
ncbi:DUF1772 domain-containing protein [Microbacterium sp. NEAU-LLC]|uniref:DUF1772 domain-containing protein n=1 Tax=Microbacterium helvum TaxID=2773713 RepID=A0ABR8NLE1_9MICO|nr:anthrone oxygenase family protein [Microbacterium helvum]MBD3941228.1 DUF1772 domain-containing protein [Microbacterium helvum]